MYKASANIGLVIWSGQCASAFLDPPHTTVTNGSVNQLPIFNVISRYNQGARRELSSPQETVDLALGRERSVLISNVLRFQGAVVPVRSFFFARLS